jgi:hypothetical protein
MTNEQDNADRNAALEAEAQRYHAQGWRITQRGDRFRIIFKGKEGRRRLPGRTASR